MRTLAIRTAVAVVGVILSAGCELATEGRKGPSAGEDDASVTTSPVSDCDLACPAGERCEISAQGAFFCTSVPAKLDAGSTPPAATCTPACASGTHCVGTACVADTTPAPPNDAGTTPVDAGTTTPPVTQSDAGTTTPPVTCSPACSTGTHCVVSGASASCVDDPVTPPTTDAGVGVQCGKNTCSDDQVCCSPSCGKCGPKNGVCSAIACLPEDAGVTPIPTCATTLCPAGTYCDDISGKPVCTAAATCDNIMCGAGYTCELVQVVCVRAPCPPVPECVAITCDPACATGSHCVVSGASASCQPDVTGVTCGKKTCSAGQICCSASCGMCGPKNGACTDLACPDQGLDIDYGN